MNVLWRAAVMTDKRAQALLGDSGGFPAEVTEADYRRAVARAETYLRSVQVLFERAKVAEEASTARVLSSARTLRIARQVLARLRMLGRRFDRN
jgi:hypothetical protein